MRVAIAQLGPGPSTSDNLAAIAQATTRASNDGSALVVFPEMSMFFQHDLDDSYVRAGQTIPGPFTAAVDALAKKHRIAITVGMIEAVPGEDHVHNTIYVTSADGTQIGAYRKVHLYDAFGLRESDVIAPSDDLEPTLFDIGGIRFGVMTCYDLRFPESARVLIDAGAEVLLLPSAWTPGFRKEDHWETLIRARAIENTCYVVAANQATPLSTGSSMVVDPMGLVIVHLADGPDVRSADIDAQRIAAVRLTNPSLANRRYRVQRSADVIV
jgi:predicted amidohydrolase